MIILSNLSPNLLLGVKEKIGSNFVYIETFTGLFNKLQPTEIVFLETAAQGGFLQCNPTVNLSLRS